MPSICTRACEKRWVSQGEIRRCLFFPSFETLLCLSVYLTHLDYADTVKILKTKLENHLNGIERSWKHLNTVSKKMPRLISELTFDFDLALLGDWLDQRSNARGRREKLSCHCYQGKQIFAQSVDLTHFFDDRTCSRCVIVSRERITRPLLRRILCTLLGSIRVS